VPARSALPDPAYAHGSDLRTRGDGDRGRDLAPALDPVRAADGGGGTPEPLTRRSAAAGAPSRRAVRGTRRDPGVHPAAERLGRLDGGWDRSARAAGADPADRCGLVPRPA